MVHLTCCCSNPWIGDSEEIRHKRETRTQNSNYLKIQELHTDTVSTYNTASACIRPITDGIGPDSLLPCNDLARTNGGGIDKSIVDDFVMTYKNAKKWQAHTRWLLAGTQY